MAANEIRKGDIGTVFEVTIKDGPDIVPLQLASVKRFHFFKPDNTCLEVNASFVTDGSDGKLQYTTVTGDLSLTGDWKLQAYIKLPAWEGKSDIVTFPVHGNVCENL